MRRSKAYSIQINRPYDEVYAFVSQPLNFAAWGPIHDGKMEHLGGMDYRVALPSAKMVLRFSEPNRFGVMDYWIFPEGGQPGLATPVRLVRNDEGCELVVLWLQRVGESDVQFDSEIDWLTADLGVLKSLLEV